MVKGQTLAATAVLTGVVVSLEYLTPIYRWYFPVAFGIVKSTPQKITPASGEQERGSGS